MDLLVYLILLALGGLIIGALARLLVPGPDPMSLLGTMALGITGSLLAGVLTALIFDDPNAGGFLLALAIAIVIVIALRPSNRGHPGSV